MYPGTIRFKPIAVPIVAETVMLVVSTLKDHDSIGEPGSEKSRTAATRSSRDAYQTK